ncbi:glycosyltransferase family 2 protein [Salipiger thiooxidans]|uniref:glycosyltransferase family 2 protein n=1 Tax=Salipiger thiooxidans TaxID=282683 RepID=UPI001CD6417D|nr:glycosyltransferase family 2 protein [Salipiger thiooxidans]MCA0849962.1 glycosyltransferase [Salipiger thiooxidans]
MSDVAVLVPTFRRPEMLARCLASIAGQDLFSVDSSDRVTVIVGDNNPDASACTQIAEMAAGYPCALRAIHVTEPGLCRNRNALFAEALAMRADYVVLIDDDEWAGTDWLSTLLGAMRQTGADAMVGPVHTIFHPDAPEWFRRSGIGQSDARNEALPTGSRSPKLASHNTILKGEILTALEPPWFPLELNFLGAEDQAFFWRASAAGHDRILWCAEAALTEEMPLARSDRRYFIDRSLQRGTSAVIAAKIINPLLPAGRARHPLRITLKEMLRLVAGLPMLLLPTRRSRYIRHAIYVAGRLQAHLGHQRNFYGS